MRTLQCLALAAMLIGLSAPLHAQDLYGSIAFSQEDDGGYAWGIAWRFGSRFDATREAVTQCRYEKGGNCKEVGWFNNACGVLAIGDDNGYGAGWGDTTAAAERDALRQCRVSNDNCRVEVARCSDSRQAAGGSGRTKGETAPAEAPVAKAEPCRIQYMDASVPQADWSGPCADGLATGEGEARFEQADANHTMSAVYRGQAHNGRFHGRGHFSSGGEVYEGEFRNGRLYSGSNTMKENGSCRVIITIRQGAWAGQSGC